MLVVLFVIILMKVGLWLIDREVERQRQADEAAAEQQRKQKDIEAAEKAATQERNDRQKAANLARLEEEERKRERAAERAIRMLPELEGICLREWGHFRAQHDPLGKSDVFNLRRSFATTFVRTYSVDAPLLWLSERIEVREIVKAHGSWPRPGQWLDQGLTPLRITYR